MVHSVLERRRFVFFRVRDDAEFDLLRFFLPYWREGLEEAEEEEADDEFELDRWEEEEEEELDGWCCLRSLLLRDNEDDDSVATLCDDK
mmetsp:Transcript_187/g.245  ORF Transcript_187/g.245 Transcript_187/m.245 type:complete len:89 (+) Transcript_187:2905-3171(+)